MSDCAMGRSGWWWLFAAFLVVAGPSCGDRQEAPQVQYCWDLEEVRGAQCVLPASIAEGFEALRSRVLPGDLALVVDAPEAEDPITVLAWASGAEYPIASLVPFPPSVWFTDQNSGLKKEMDALGHAHFSGEALDFLRAFVCDVRGQHYDFEASAARNGAGDRDKADQDFTPVTPDTCAVTLYTPLVGCRRTPPCVLHDPWVDQPTGVGYGSHEDQDCRGEVRHTCGIEAATGRAPGTHTRTFRAMPCGSFE